MACKTPTKGKTDRKINSFENTLLKEKGRLQYFYHSPSSELPIRDVLNEQREGHKKEPHIEIGAENYWVGCYQSNNIRPFINNDEKYLFLMTTCRNKKLKSFYSKKFIVGYISKEAFGENTKDIFFVKGKTFLFSFKDSIPIERLGYSKFTRTKLINEKDTKKILQHLRKKKNILLKCVNEIKKLDENNMTCARIKERKKCLFKDECLRWN